MPARRRVALATAAEAAGLDEDESPTIAALGALGIDGIPAVWDDLAVDWRSFDLVVLRSTWDYVPRLVEFLAWVEHTATLTSVLSPPEVIRWNTDKVYLRDLERAGIPITPTWWLEPGDEVTWPAEWDEVVVKPSVSAGSKDTARHAPEHDAAARAHVERLLAAGRTTMVQPYLPGVDEVGEAALVYLDGGFSHAATKAAILRPAAGFVEGLFAAEQITPRTPSVAERALGEQVAAFFRERFGDLLYARIDLIPGPDGTPVVLELEMTEPSLFLPYVDGAADRLAAAIAARLARR